MSMAWQNPKPVWREPWSAFWTRLAVRTIEPAIALGLAGVPGTGWDGLIPWTWLRWTVLVIAVPFLVLWLLAIANLLKNRRVLLRRMPTGTFEWPQSIQERWLKIPLEWVGGREVQVYVPADHLPVGRGEPKVTLAGEGGIKRFPLHGVSVADFVEWVNTETGGQPPLLVEAEPPAPELPDPEPAS